MYRWKNLNLIQMKDCQMKNNNISNNEKMYEQLAQRVIERFSSIDNWKQSWQNPPLNTLPYNATTEDRYRGFNAIALILSSIEQNFSDPRWMTFKQAKDAGATVKRGSKSTMISYFERTKIDETTAIPKGLWLDKTEKTKLKEELANQGIHTYGDLLHHSNASALIKNITPENEKKVALLLNAIKQGNAFDIISKTYHVFNAQQIEGLPEIDLKIDEVISIQEKQKHLNAIESIIDNSGVMLDISPTGKPMYIPSQDTVQMPSPSRFQSVYEYYATFTHELAHSTKHPNRENRPKLDYAREELVAEFASMIINTQAGLVMSQEHFDNHAAYLKSWSKQAGDPRELFNVIKDAGRAAEYVLELINTPDKEINPDRKTLNNNTINEKYHNFKDIIIKLAAEDKLDARDAAEKIAIARTIGIKETKLENEDIYER